MSKTPYLHIWPTYFSGNGPSLGTLPLFAPKVEMLESPLMIRLRFSDLEKSVTISEIMNFSKSVFTSAPCIS